MKDLNVVDGLHGASDWLMNNQDLFIQYAGNIVTAIAILVIGSIASSMASNMVNRVIKLRGIDTTIVGFL